MLHDMVKVLVAAQVEDVRVIQFGMKASIPPFRGLDHLYCHYSFADTNSFDIGQTYAESDIVLFKYHHHSKLWPMLGPLGNGYGSINPKISENISIVLFKTGT